MRRRIASFTMVLALCLPAIAHAAAPSREVRADSLVAEARRRYAEGSFGQRRIAIRMLEDAVQLAPGRASTLEALGRAYLDAGFQHRARVALEQAAAADAQSPEAWYGLAQLYKRNWLRSLASEDFTRALAHAETVVRLDPRHGGAVVLLAMLRVERGDFAEARRLVTAAEQAGCRAPELQLAAAYLAYRAGAAARAESLLAVVRPRLTPEVSARFDDVAPMLDADAAEAAAALPATARRALTATFWDHSDPDPTTPLNEAVVEYHARVAHALLLFADTWNARWDMRAALYVRFGAPGRVSFLPAGLEDGRRLHQRKSVVTTPLGEVRDLSMDLEVPTNVQVWEYPALGMTVQLQDLVLSQNYEMPRAESLVVEARADTAVAEASGLAAAAAGRAVFSPLLPGTRRLEVAGRLSRFSTAAGAHVLAQFELPGSPADSLSGECVLLDSTGARLTRVTAHPDPWRCDPAARRSLEFAFDLPAGRYRLAFAVSDGHDGRGVARATLEVPAAASGLALSDVVPVCGPYDASAGQGPVRLASNVESRFAGESRLHAYFEVYGLATDATGMARFDLAYEVHGLAGDPMPWYRRITGGRAPARIAMRTEESSPGSLRRQFVQMPLEALPPGEYRLDVHVHDALGGGTVSRSLQFVR